MATAKKGADVHGGITVPLASLQKAGVEFLLIRCGYGGDYTDQDDSGFFRWVNACKAAGVPYGVWLYSYALTVEQAQSEAAHALRLLRKVDVPAYGVWFDMEDADRYKEKRGMPSNDTLVRICDTFCSTVQAAGYYCGIYAGLSWLENQLKDPRLDRYDKWVAQWNATCDYKGDYGIWQYSGQNGRVTKIDDQIVDMDLAYKDYPTLTKGGSSVSDGYSKTSRVFSEQGNKITTPFSSGHQGVDLGWDKNPQTPVIAHSEGTVVFCQTGIPTDRTAVGNNRSYGNCVKIKHPNGFYTLYAHLSSVAVKLNQPVKKGQQIGLMGMTGNSSGPHLHFEVRNGSDTRINPTPYIDADLPGLPTVKEDEVDMTKEEVTKLIENTVTKAVAAAVPVAVKQALAAANAEVAKQGPSKWAQPAVAYVCEHGLMANTGTEEEPAIDRPQSPLTRQEAAQMSMNLHKKLTATEE